MINLTGIIWAELKGLLENLKSECTSLLVRFFSKIK